jgi:hypothetical protein
MHEFVATVGAFFTGFIAFFWTLVGSWFGL